MAMLCNVNCCNFVTIIAIEAIHSVFENSNCHPMSILDSLIHKSQNPVINSHTTVNETSLQFGKSCRKNMYILANCHKYSHKNEMLRDLTDAKLIMTYTGIIQFFGER
jgi:hypothetical protein